MYFSVIPRTSLCVLSASGADVWVLALVSATYSVACACTVHIPNATHYFRQNAWTQIASFDLAGFWPHNASKTVSATDEQ
eukprot:3748665-Pleurochrysis_carterae.AAC.1